MTDIIFLTVMFFSLKSSQLEHLDYEYCKLNIIEESLEEIDEIKSFEKYLEIIKSRVEERCE
jgi:hypothetical protein